MSFFLSRAVAAADRALAGPAGAMARAGGVLLRGLWRLVTLRADAGRCLAEFDRAIVGAIPLVLLTGAATGAVLVWQTEEGLARFGASVYAARIAAVSLVREIAPVLVGLLLAARVGSAMAAELGSMAITEQLDAMRALALDADRHLTAPRLLALGLGLPCLVLAFDAAGLAGGILTGVLDRGIPLPAYLEATQQAITMTDVRFGLLKAFAFGLLLAAFACAEGLATDPKAGAGAVGRATTAAVVSACLSILAADAVMTRLFLGA